MYPQPYYKSGFSHLPHTAARAARKSNRTRPIRLQGLAGRDRHSWYSNCLLFTPKTVSTLCSY